MPNNGIAAKTIKAMSELTNLPASFDGNPYLYALALTSVMCIATLGIGVAGWMVRDIWRDRHEQDRRSLLTNFRGMMGLVGFTAFVRSMPEVLYLQVYGDPSVSVEWQTRIFVAKRVADSFSLWLVVGWISIFVIIYPYIVAALKTAPAGEIRIEIIPSFRRLRRPAVCFAVIAIVSALFAYAKIHGVN